MPKLYSSNHILYVLGKHGFQTISQRGSHIKLRNSDNPVKTVIVPAGRKEIPLGTFRSILRQSGLNDIDFK